MSAQRERISFETDAETKTRLERWAAAEDRSVGSLIRLLIMAESRRRGDDASQTTLR